MPKIINIKVENGEGFINLEDFRDIIDIERIESFQMKPGKDYGIEFTFYDILNEQVFPYAYNCPLQKLIDRGVYPKTLQVNIPQATKILNRFPSKYVNEYSDDKWSLPIRKIKSKHKYKKIVTVKITYKTKTYNEKDCIIYWLF